MLDVPCYLGLGIEADEFIYGPLLVSGTDQVFFDLGDIPYHRRTSVGETRLALVIRRYYIVVLGNDVIRTEIRRFYVNRQRIALYRRRRRSTDLRYPP